MNKNNNMIRLLILSHNALSKNQSNGKTIYSLIKNVPKENIAQIYLTTDIPDFDLCNKYFQINDFHIIKRIYNKKIQGLEVKYEDIRNLNIQKEKVSKSIILEIVRSIKGTMFTLIRDSIWLLSGYRTDKLKIFIEEFKPNILLFQTSGSIFSMRLARWIANKYGIKLIMETTDDYLRLHISFNPFYYYLNFKLKYEYIALTKISENIIVISQEMFEEYKKNYNSSYYIAMNSIYIKDVSIKKSDCRIKMLYSGNIGLGRWKTLLLLSSIIEDMNKNIELEIYTLSNINYIIRQKFKKFKKTKIKGSISSKELYNIRPDYDILVHVESFNKKNKIITRLSISTKISEYLASKRAILAIGPNNIASILYLKRIKAAEIVTVLDKKKIKESIIKLLDVEYRNDLAKNGYSAAIKNHDITKVADDIVKIMKEAIK